MPGFYTSNYVSDRLVAESVTDGSGLKFTSHLGDGVHIAGLPLGVAQATADAFNAAMDAAEDAAPAVAAE